MNQNNKNLVIVFSFVLLCAVFMYFISDVVFHDLRYRKISVVANILVAFIFALCAKIVLLEERIKHMEERLNRLKVKKAPALESPEESKE